MLSPFGLDFNVFVAKISKTIYLWHPTYSPCHMCDIINQWIICVSLQVMEDEIQMLRKDQQELKRHGFNGPTLLGDTPILNAGELRL